MAKTLVVNGIHNLYCTGGIYPPEISGGQRASGMVHGPEAGTDDALGTRLPARHLRELAVKRRRRLMEPGRYDMGRHRDLQAAVLGCKPDFQSHKFDPVRWAALAADCGFKYLLFTTKHHDGFCMYDTDTTDYKITAESCPIHTHKDADIVGALFREFRRQGLGISVYFSKPDWHSEYYWAPQFGTAPDRNVNYDVSEHPDLWEKYVQFAHQQIRELCTNYGKVDVLWLDGGWGAPR